MISELVWENQQRVTISNTYTTGEETTPQWIHVACNPVDGVAPFVSANRGDLGGTLEQGALVAQ